MRILVAPTAFKGSYSPAEVAKAMAEGVSEFSRVASQDIYIDLAPLADGGDGTVESIAVATAALKCIQLAKGSFETLGSHLFELVRGLLGIIHGKKYAK